MNNLIEKTVKHLSKTAERIIPEKSMTDAEIEKLLSDTENAVDKIVNDKERHSSERKEARGVRKFLNGVRKDWEKNGSLHPNQIISVMKTNTGVNSGRYGYTKSGFDGSPSGFVPKNFSRKSEQFQKRMREKYHKWKLNDRFRQFVNLSDKLAK